MASAFPRLSPSGRRVVAGEHVIVVDRSIEVGPGTSAQWADEERLYFIRQPDGAFVTTIIGSGKIDVVRDLGFANFSAPGFHHWAGYRAGAGVVFSNGYKNAGWSDPALSVDRAIWAARVIAGGSIITESGRPSLYADHDCVELRFFGQALAWTVVERGWRWVAGRLSPSSGVVRLGVDANEGWPVPFLVDGRFWLLTLGADRLVLRPWGEAHGYVVAHAPTFTPDAAVLPDGRIRIVWDAGHDVLGERIIDPRTEPRVDLRVTTTPVDPKEPDVSVRDVPNLMSVIERCKRDFPDAWKNCHRATVSRELAEEFVRRAAHACWLEDRRFGLNGKRGDANTISQDCVCFKHDDGRESVIDFGGGAGGDNPTVQWSIVGHYLPPGPPLQLWIKPEPVSGSGGGNTGGGNSGGTGGGSTRPFPAFRWPEDVFLHALTRYINEGLYERDKPVENPEGTRTASRGALMWFVPIATEKAVALISAKGNALPTPAEWWRLADDAANAAIDFYRRTAPPQ